ncbi:MAG: hypothetical protein GXP38_14315 [Chloroflexi bacterium]|nr:hypothetical protein [Chloroflexota bacterium]
MLIESLSVVILILFLALAGSGVAIWLVSGTHLIIHAAAIAPALGLAILHLVSFPLYRYYAPVSVWIQPAFVFLLIANAALIALWLRSHCGQISLPAFAELVWPLSGFAIVIAILVLPMTLMGIQYAVFRSNASDAFLYMSFAESARQVDWQILRAGSQLVTNNLENINRLATEAPTALLTARFLGRPMAINHMVSMAALATAVGISTTHFYYAFNVLCFAVTAPVLMALGHRLYLPKLLTILAAMVAVAGFWARLVLEMDAGFEIAALPLVALLIYGLIQLEDSYAIPRWKSIILIGVAGAAISAVYPPPLIVVVFAAFGLVIVHSTQGRTGREQVLLYIKAMGATLLILLLTGQLDYHVPASTALFAVAEVQEKFRAVGAQQLVTDLLGAVAGIPIHAFFASFSRTIRIPLWLAANLIGFLVLLVILAGYRWYRTQSHASTRRVLLFISLGAVVLYLFFVVAGNTKSADKIFTYTYPYFILTAVIGASVVMQRFPTAVGKGTRILVAGWLTIALIAGTVLPFIQQPNSYFQRSNRIKGSDSYDIDKLISTIAVNTNDLILVNAPAETGWQYPYYLMLALSSYNTYYQAGLVLDNSTEYRNFLLPVPPQHPAYLLTRATSDYLAGDFGSYLLAQVGNMRLYRITSAAQAVVAEEIERSRNIMAEKPLFPSLVSED